MEKFEYRLPAGLAADIEQYAGEVDRFIAGKIPAALFRAKRVPRGIYEQRKDGTYMVRVRLAGGIINAGQAGELARLSSAYGNGLLHVTTRQDIQFHDVPIERTPAIMHSLARYGLTTKGGGGNTVRNVTACPYAGICPAEQFDVTGCACAVTDYLIAQPGSYNLPRKYKISFSGCAADCALAQVSDLGFIAELRDGRPGFRVLAGGGMGSDPRIADVLSDWIPVRDITRTAEAVRRLFDKLGDRNNKHRARLRFVFERIGAGEFRRLFSEQTDELLDYGLPEPGGNIEPNSGATDVSPAQPPLEIINGIRVVKQRQPGFVTVPLHLPLGFLPVCDFKAIATAAAEYSLEEGIRTSRSQNIVIRFVREENVAALAGKLSLLRTDVLARKPLDRFTACAGASTCRLGICLARNAAKACADAISEAGVPYDAVAAMEFNINGCSNACGQQPVGAIGMYGIAQRAFDRLLPSYVITIGGRCGPDGARFGIPAGRIPAGALPAFATGLARDFAEGRRANELFQDYSDRLGPGHFSRLADRYSPIPNPSERPGFYRDIGADSDFSLAGRGAGECGAGVFEVIRQDLEASGKASRAFDILLPATRALLVTRGIDSTDPDTIFREFERHFMDTGLVDERYRSLMTRARGYAQGWSAALDGMEPDIISLRERIELLFSTLDGNLEFHPPDSATKPIATPDSQGPGKTVELDLGGVPCPMNFVKAKLKLEGMDTGDTLSIILDDGDPVNNVPASFRGEGQDVAGINDLGNGKWRVVIRKLK